MKIKVLSLLICIVLSAVLFSSCQTINEGWVPAGMKKVSSDAVDYTLYIPESWTEDISTGVVSAYVNSRDRSNITMAAFTLTNDEQYASPDDYWVKYEEQLRLTFPDFAYASPVEDTADTANTADTADTANTTQDTRADTQEAQTEETQASDRNGNPLAALLGGVAANKYFYTATVTGTAYQYMQVVALRNATVYIFTYTAIPGNFELHLPEVNDILTNFKFN